MDDTGCLKDEVPNEMNDRDGWRERVKKRRDGSMEMMSGHSVHDKLKIHAAETSPS
eukprot:gene16973-8475_t